MRLTVLQWNIMYSENVEAVAAFIKELNPDVVCLQELTQGYQEATPDAGAYIAAALGYEGFWDYGIMTLPDGGPARVGCGIFSRFGGFGGERVVLQEGLVKQGKVVRDERSYVSLWVKLPSDIRLKVGSVHLPFHPRFRTSAHKLEMIGRLLEETSEGPYILAGDMNATPRSKAVQALRGRLKHAGPALSQKTWTTKPFEIGPWRYDELKWRLDHVLYQGALRPVRSRVVPTELSDHLPVLVEFEV